MEKKYPWFSASARSLNPDAEPRVRSFLTDIGRRNTTPICELHPWLRAGFTGRKERTPAEQANLESVLTDVLGTLGQRLAETAPGVPVGAGREPGVARFCAARLDS